ncbi:glycosyltransferase family 4 protein [Planotetraspora sp. GP83]|uniref:glycosyltransferase family 4 protein n=1 Tax=Planotetraspora sp. GP83 TaxID=3156264 RepID=UPI0035162BD3
MTTITGVDLPPGSPGGSVELLRDLYLAPDRLIPADVFMLAPPDAASGSASDSGAPGSDRPALLAVPGKQVDGAGFWAYVDALAAAIRERFPAAGYGVVHLQHLAFGATPALLRAFPRHPHLALVHGTDLLFAADHPTQAEVLKEAVAAARAIVVPTTAMATLLGRLAPADSSRIAHIPWGIPDHLLSEPPERHRHAGGDLRLLYAGRLTAEKAGSGLFEALAGLDGVTLSVAAPPAEYRRLDEESGLAGVRYLGWLSRPDLWRAFAEHDLLIVPSTRLEAFGLVAVEAQACGLPVLYQPVPGLLEVLGDSAIPVDLAAGPHAIAEAVSWLRKDPAALDDVRAAGYRNAARFPLSRTAKELQALSEQIQG